MVQPLDHERSRRALEALGADLAARGVSGSIDDEAPAIDAQLRFPAVPDPSA